VALGALSETRDATAETTGTVNNFTYGNFHAQGSAANGVVSIGKTGAERQLIHVAAGKVSADSTDAINGSQLFVTNRGLSYLGDTLVTNILGGDAAVVKNGDTLGTLTMSNIGGTGKNTIDDAIKAAKTEVKTEKQATLKTDTGANGQSIYTIGATKTTLTEGTKVSVTGGEEDANGIINYTVGIDKPTSDKIDSIGTGNVAAGDSNTVTGATVHQYIEDNPITFVGEDNANPLKKKLGETLKFTSGDIDSDYKGSNLKVKSDGTNIVVGFKESPTFKDITADSLNIANGGPTINKDGINMNGKKITNLAPGEADTDAVNVSQLKDSVQNVNNSSPFEYAKGDEPLVKGKDGKFYPAKNFAQLTYDPATNSYKDANNTPVTPVDNNEVVIRAKGDTPQPVTNVKSNLPATYNKDANNPTTTAQATPSAEEVKNIGNNAATVNDILNAGWNLQENGGAKDFVKAYDTVNFVDGEGTKANVTVREDGTIADVTFNIDKGNITVDPNGTGKAEGTPEADIKAAEEKVKEAEEKLANLPNNASDEDKAKAAKDVADAKKAVAGINNKVATVENVVNAINNVSWTATSGQKGTGISTDATEEKVKAGDTVKFNAGDNLKIEQAGKDFTYSLNPELKNLTSAEFVATDPKGNKITTVTDGNGITITPAKPEEGKAPVSLTSNGLSNGNNSITNVKSNLPNTYNQVLDKDGNPIKDTNGNPVTTTASQAAPSAEDVKNMGDNAATVNDILNAGWNLQENGGAKDFVKAYDTVNFVNGEGTKANVTVREDGKIADVTFNIDKGNITMNPDNSGTVQGTPQSEKDAAEKALKAAKDTLANLPTTAPKSVKDAAEKALQDAQKDVDNINNRVATVENVAYAINNAAWNVDAGTVENSNGKLVKGSSDKPTKVKAGNTVKLNAGNNIEIKRNAHSIDIATSATPSFTNVSLGSDGAKIGSDGQGNVRVSNAQGAPTRITNVAPGINNTDAVNYGQLRGAVNNINNRINKVDKDLRAGVAGAAAIAFIQRPNEAGKSIVSVGAAGYRGESALAVGYARNADNNKISIKLGVGVNSRNDVTYGGSVGYQW